MPQPIYLNIDRWIHANKEYFLPPVCNKMMHDNQLKVFYVGGPNIREDYHIEQGEELFYMKNGDMVLKILHNGKSMDIPIKEGEIFLLPARVPHSPQRFKDTTGLVIERERKSEEIDCIRWYVKNSAEILYEKWVYVNDLGTQVASAIKEFQASEQSKTGKPIAGTISNKPPFALNDKCHIGNPFSLKNWLQTNKQEIHEKGFKKMFGDIYQTTVNVYGRGQQDGFTGLNELFLWQLEGRRDFTILGKQYSIESGDTLLIPQDKNYTSFGSDDCLTLTVQMDRA